MEKSSLNRPLKFLIRIISSLLPREVRLTAVFSNRSFDFTTTSSFLPLSLLLRFVDDLSSSKQGDFCDDFDNFLKQLQLAVSCRIFFLHFRCGLIIFSYGDQRA